MASWKRRYLPSIHPQDSRRHHQQQQKEDSCGGGGGYGGVRFRTDSQRPNFQSWKEEHCYSVGTPQRKLYVSETKKSKPFYRKIIQWNDSAAEEAFHNAKVRFQAQIRGIQCEVPFPDPDEFIDEIDWDAKINPELLLNLEEPSYPLPEDKDTNPSSRGSACDSSLVKCTQWGDVDPATRWNCLEKKKKKKKNTNGWDCSVDWGNGTSWDNTLENVDKSWGQWETDKNDNLLEQWQNWKRAADLNYYTEAKMQDKVDRNVCEWQPYGSRNKDSKAGNNHHSYNNTSQYFKGRKRPSHGYEETLHNKRHIGAMQRDRYQTCRRTGQQRYVEAGGAWPDWQK